MPPHRFGVVLWDAEAVAVHEPEVELRFSVSLLRPLPLLVKSPMTGFIEEKW